MNRRQIIAGAGALGAAALLPRGARAQTAQTTYRLMREGADIGRHTKRARIENGAFVVDIAIDIAVKVLGITAYRYTLENTETWAGGRIVSVRSTVNDDGTADRCRVDAKGEVLEIDGSGFSGTAPGDAATTSYFAKAFVERKTWISTQSGLTMAMTAQELGGTPEGWAVSGQLGDAPFATKLYYDAGGEWVASSFDARGATIEYELIDGGGVNALWESA